MGPGTVLGAWVKQLLLIPTPALALCPPLPCLRFPSCSPEACANLLIPLPTLFFPQMYGRYTQDLGTFAKDEAARLRLKQEHEDSGTLRPRRPSELLEYSQGRCAPCCGKGDGDLSGGTPTPWHGGQAATCSSGHHCPPSCRHCG